MNNNDTIKKMLFLQKGEITDYVIYTKLAARQKLAHNKEILTSIAKDEMSHYKFLEIYTKQKVKPSRFKVLFFFLIARIFGLTFGIKLMEKAEDATQHIYNEIKDQVEGIDKIINDEEEHERELIEALDEEKLKYISSIVLGLNDALVELTGTLAGLTLALNRTKWVAAAGLITGIAACLSMASSEYLARKQEETTTFAIRSSIYTGGAYLLAVILLVLPYFLIGNIYYALMTTVLVVVLIVFVFNYYISVAKDYSFKKRFLEMIVISLSVSFLSFIIGYFVNMFIGINV